MNGWLWFALLIGVFLNMGVVACLVMILVAAFSAGETGAGIAFSVIAVAMAAGTIAGVKLALPWKGDR